MTRATKRLYLGIIVFVSIPFVYIVVGYLSTWLMHSMPANNEIEPIPPGELTLSPLHLGDLAAVLLLPAVPFVLYALAFAAPFAILALRYYLQYKRSKRQLQHTSQA